MKYTIFLKVLGRDGQNWAVVCLGVWNFPFLLGDFLNGDFKPSSHIAFWGWWLFYKEAYSHDQVSCCFVGTQNDGRCGHMCDTAM